MRVSNKFGRLNKVLLPRSWRGVLAFCVGALLPCECALRNQMCACLASLLLESIEFSERILNIHYIRVVRTSSPRKILINKLHSCNSLGLRYYHSVVDAGWPFGQASYLRLKTGSRSRQSFIQFWVEKFAINVFVIVVAQSL